jgi:hypothetical protein
MNYVKASLADLLYVVATALSVAFTVYVSTRGGM